MDQDIMEQEYTIKLFQEYVEEEETKLELTGIEYLDKVDEFNPCYSKKMEREKLKKWTEEVLKSQKSNRYLINLVSSYMEDDINLTDQKDSRDNHECFTEDLLKYKLNFLLKHKIFDMEETQNVFRSDTKIFTIEKFCTILYCRSHMNIIDIIFRECPTLLVMTENILKKVVFYGRYKILDFFLNKLPDKLENVLKSGINPYKLDSKRSGYLSGYVNDIWNGWSWGNDECEKPGINPAEDSDFKETFAILDKLSEKYQNIKFSDDIKKEWIQYSLYSNSPYIIGVYSLLKQFGLDKIDNKESVKKLIKLIGYDHAWKLITEKSSDMLRLLIN